MLVSRRSSSRRATTLRIRLLLARLIAGRRYQVIPKLTIYTSVTGNASTLYFRWPDACL